jgi:hypothetical protein
MNSNEINDLFITARMKNIKNKEIAKAVRLSETSISLFFRHKLKLSDHNEKAIKNYIQNKTID